MTEMTEMNTNSPYKFEQTGDKVIFNCMYNCGKKYMVTKNGRFTAYKNHLKNIHNLEDAQASMLIESLHNDVLEWDRKNRTDFSDDEDSESEDSESEVSIEPRRSSRLKAKEVIEQEKIRLNYLMFQKNEMKNKLKSSLETATKLQEELDEIDAHINVCRNIIDYNYTLMF